MGGGDVSTSVQEWWEGKGSVWYFHRTVTNDPSLIQSLSLITHTDAHNKHPGTWNARRRMPSPQQEEAHLGSVWSKPGKGDKAASFKRSGLSVDYVMPSEPWVL